MKSKLYLSLIVLLFTAAACGNSDEKLTPAADPQEAAREFIRASLDGNYDKASFYLFKDSTGVNEMLLKRWQRDYAGWSKEEKSGHKDASIIVLGSETMGDTAVNFRFSNSFKKDSTTIRIIKAKEGWLVDLKDIH